MKEKDMMEPVISFQHAQSDKSEMSLACLRNKSQ